MPLARPREAVETRRHRGMASSQAACMLVVARHRHVIISISIYGCRRRAGIAHRGKQQQARKAAAFHLKNNHDGRAAYHGGGAHA